MKKVILVIMIMILGTIVLGEDASFYGGKLHGSMTASGERFNQHEFTAAHKQLPLHSIVDVTNPSNGKTVRVRINDRGPYVKGRSIDLSAAAFAAIENPNKGIIKNVIINVVSLGDNRRNFTRSKTTKKKKTSKVTRTSSRKKSTAKKKTSKKK